MGNRETFPTEKHFAIGVTIFLLCSAIECMRQKTPEVEEPKSGYTALNQEEQKEEYVDLESPKGKERESGLG